MLFKLLLVVVVVLVGQHLAHQQPEVVRFVSSNHPDDPPDSTSSSANPAPAAPGQNLFKLKSSQSHPKFSYYYVVKQPLNGSSGWRPLIGKGQNKAFASRPAINFHVDEGSEQSRGDDETSTKAPSRKYGFLLPEVSNLPMTTVSSHGISGVVTTATTSSPNTNKTPKIRFPQTPLVVWKPTSSVRPAASSSTTTTTTTTTTVTPLPDLASPPTASSKEFPGLISETLRQLGGKVFVSLLQRAQLLDDVFSSTAEPFTLFMPTDAAFGNFIRDQHRHYNEVLLADSRALRAVLLQHFSPNIITNEDLNKVKLIKTLAANGLEVIQTKDGLLIGGALLSPLQPNLALTNGGKVYLLNQVIFPMKTQLKISEDPSKQDIDKIYGSGNVNDPALVVRTRSGRIKGLVILDGTIHAWLGVPYAEPPLGSLRFARPLPVKSWAQSGEIRETMALPNACMQTPDETFGEFAGATQWNPNTQISEDCLYLNVFAPSSKQKFKKPLPVLVWLYGGGFSTGSSSLEVYDPSVLVKRGNLIFVSLQYRLGAHGFLYFGQKSSAPGNVGLLDQVMALKWINENIQAFGGDPNQVTLMGESAGANSVALHIMSPMSCHLFQRAILQSSGATPRWGFATKQEAFQRSVKLAQLVGCEVSTEDMDVNLDCLRSVPSINITNLEFDVEAPSLNWFPFLPTVDGAFLPASPRTLLLSGSFSTNISLLIGSNANEGFWSLMYLLPDVFPNKELSVEQRAITEEQYHKTVGRIFPFYPRLVQKLIAFFYRNSFSTKDRYFRALDQMVGDSEFVCNTEDFAQIMSKKGMPVFRYFYNHHSSLDSWPSWSGSKHGDEIEFTFGRPLQMAKAYAADEVTLAHDMVTMWLNFVSEGNPNPSGDLISNRWPLYQGPEWKYLNLTSGYSGLTDSRHLDDRCRFWSDIMPEFVTPKLDPDDLLAPLNTNLCIE